MLDFSLQLASLMESEEYLITALANSAALINQFLDNINWAGYYLYQDGKLILGPFQGLPACEIIPLTKGVCGACASAKETIVVEDVHKFPGHIACDSASNSEIVVPLLIDGNLYGLIDIDSPLFNRFGEEEKEVLEKCGRIMEATIKRLLNE